MADTAAAEPALITQQQLCSVCSGELSMEDPAVCVSCSGDKSEASDGLKQNGTAEVPEIKSKKEESRDSKMTEEIKVQEDFKDSEDPKKPDEDKKEEEPQTNGVAKQEEVKEEPLGPDDVVCDSCIESPRRSLKSCLTCLVSYCEGHLRPHLENPKFQNHRLVEPLRDIERRTCESHKWPLELFCCADACCICQDCVTEDHRGHNTMSVVDARSRIEASFLTFHISVF